MRRVGLCVPAGHDDTHELLGSEVIELPGVLAQYVLVEGAVRAIAFAAALHRALVLADDLLCSAPLALDNLASLNLHEPFLLLDRLNLPQGLPVVEEPLHLALHLSHFRDKLCIQAAKGLDLAGRVLESGWLEKLSCATVLQQVLHAFVEVLLGFLHCGLRQVLLAAYAL